MFLDADKCALHVVGLVIDLAVELLQHIEEEVEPVVSRRSFIEERLHFEYL